MKKKIIVEIARLSIIMLLVYTAVDKLLGYSMFADQISVSPLLHELGINKSWGVHLAWLLPTCELGIACLLLFSQTRWLGFYGAIIMMLFFTGYIIYVLKWAPYQPCSCGGVISQLNWTEHIIFNLVFVALGVLGLLYNKTACITGASSMS